MLNRQAAFNAAVKGIWGQQALSISGEACQYRGPNGLRCAVGWLIPNDVYDPSIEGKGACADEVTQLISTRYTDGSLFFDDQSFLDAMQYDLHDSLTSNGGFSRGTFLARVEEFAKDYHLKMPKLD